MKNLVFCCVVVLVMGGGGAAHLIAPGSLEAFVFEPLPKTLTVLATGIVQVAIAIAVMVPKTRALAGAAFAALCVAYMPLHVWDLFRPDPVIAPLSAAIFRIFLQCVFIWVGWSLWRAGEAQRD